MEKNSNTTVKQNYIYNVIFQIFALITVFITTPYVLYNLYITKNFYKVKVKVHCRSPMNLFKQGVKNKNYIAWKCTGWIGNWEFTFIYKK